VKTFRRWWNILSRFIARRVGKQIEHIPPETMFALVSYQWPGNIRELQNFIERSVILTSGNVLHPPLASLKSGAEAESLGAITLEDAERDHIRKTLEQTRWVVAGPNGAAARLGIKRSTLYFRMQRLDISRTKRDLSPSSRVEMTRGSTLQSIDPSCSSHNTPALTSPANLNLKLFDIQSDNLTEPVGMRRRV